MAIFSARASAFSKFLLLSKAFDNRRKFDEAQKNDQTRAEHALALIQKLYDTERKARETKLDYAQRKELRLVEAKPVLDEFYQWLKENEPPKTLPKSAIGGAITYTLNLWPRLLRYLDDGKYEIDNNLIENSIRPVALGYGKLSITWAEKIICSPVLMKPHKEQQ